MALGLGALALVRARSKSKVITKFEKVDLKSNLLKENISRITAESHKDLKTKNEQNAAAYVTNMLLLGLPPHDFYLFRYLHCVFVALSHDLLSSVLFTCCLYTYFYTLFVPPLNIFTWIDDETGERYRIDRGDYDFFELFPGKWRASLITD